MNMDAFHTMLLTVSVPIIMEINAKCNGIFIVLLYKITFRRYNEEKNRSL